MTIAVNGIISVAIPADPPTGRLTLTSGVPVLTSTVSAAGTVFYTPYQGNVVPIWNGAQYVMTTFTELSNTLANSATGSAGPAACTTNSNYDLFVWNNAGVLTLTRGPLWTSDTARGSGAGTTQLTFQNGFYVNTVSITNGPGALLGTYVGTFRTNGTSTTDFNFGSSAAGGGAALFNVWNNYNRRRASSKTIDSTVNYTYTSSTGRAANASNNNRASMVMGLNEDAVQATYGQSIATVAALNAQVTIGMGLDATAAFGAGCIPTLYQDNVAATGASASIKAHFLGNVGLGFHFIQAIEVGDNVNANAFNTNAAYGGLSVSVWC